MLEIEPQRQLTDGEAVPKACGQLPVAGGAAGYAIGVPGLPCAPDLVRDHPLGASVSSGDYHVATPEGGSSRGSPPHPRPGGIILGFAYKGRRLGWGLSSSPLDTRP